MVQSLPVQRDEGRCVYSMCSFFPLWTLGQHPCMASITNRFVYNDITSNSLSLPMSQANHTLLVEEWIRPYYRGSGVPVGFSFSNYSWDMWFSFNNDSSVSMTLSISLNTASRVLILGFTTFLNWDQLMILLFVSWYCSIFMRHTSKTTHLSKGIATRPFSFSYVLVIVMFLGVFCFLHDTVKQCFAVYVNDSVLMYRVFYGTPIG